jgi:hypothetical protein
VQLRAWLGANPHVARIWSKELDLDVGDAAILSRLMLVAARCANLAGITLFSSRKAQNIMANAELMRDSRFLHVGSAFLTLVCRDVPSNLLRRTPVFERPLV